MNLIRYSIKDHPYLSVFAAWLYAFMMLGRFRIDGVMTINYLSPVIFAVLLIIGELMLMKKSGAGEEEIKKDIIKTSLASLVFTAYMLVMLWVFSIMPSMKMFDGRNSAVPFFFGLAALIGILIYFTVKKKWTIRRFTIYIFAAAFVFHSFYLMYSGLSYQWDQGQILSTGDGHIGYIEYIHNNLSLPQFDPREKWQYYHPPLNHLLHAAFLKLQTLAGVDIRIAIYNVTYLPMLYLMLLLIVFLRLTREFGVGRKYGNIMLAVCACSPAFFFIGGYVNNDMLSTLLMVASVYFAVVWYKKRKMSVIVKTALCFGLGMFTKLSVWMAAVPIAIIFITALVRDIRAKNGKALAGKLGQMGVFLGISVPLSFYWSVRNLVRFGIPLGYIPVNRDDTQLITQDVLTRLFDFNPSQLNPSWVAYVKMNDGYNEYNPLISLIKSSSSAMMLRGYINYPLFAATVLLCITGFVSMIVLLIKKKSLHPLHKAVLASFYAVIMISYYIFCFKYPVVCTEEIRYASPVIFIGAFFTACAVRELAKSKKLRRLSYVLTAVPALFCALSLVMIAYDGLYTALWLNMM